MSIYLGDKEIKGIYVGDTLAKEVYVGDVKVRPNIINFATQGPCPDGFHVPTENEWLGIISIRNSIGLTGSNKRREYLHIPLSGYRDQYSSGNITYKDSYGYLWSCTAGNYQYYSRYLYLSNGSGDISNTSSDPRTMGMNIRPFKDSFVPPTSSWIVIQGTLGGAGIFWNQTDGLISITNGSDKNYTIADKNLGATTVYHYGDTLSESNCGKYYQRGNNYGFPSTGTISKTSSTQVDGTGYGPGNYYNSDTFITGANRWTINNDVNLRGGEDGNVPVN